MAIRCCNGCVPPKRYPGCHDHCHEYIEEKKKHDAERERINKARLTQLNIYSQRGDSVRKAKRRKKL